MRRLALVAFAPAFALAWLAACGEDDAPPGAVAGNDAGASETGTTPGSNPPGTPGTPPTPAGASDVGTFCNGTFGAITSAFKGCCSEAESTTFEVVLLEGLLDGITAACNDAYGRSQGAGYLAFDAAQWETCKAAVAEKTHCPVQAPSTSDDAPPCVGVLDGIQAIGQPCLGDRDCVDGATCVGEPGGTGVCKAPPAVGEACGHKELLDGSSLVDFTNAEKHPRCATGAHCAAFTCVANGDSCATDKECTAPAHCFEEHCSTTARSPEHGPCLSRDDCVDHTFYCKQANSVTEGTCETRKVAGETCGTPQQRSECQGLCNTDAGTCKTLCGSQ